MLFVFALLAQAAAATAPTTAPPTPFQNLYDAKIVCKTVLGTGSRLNTQRLCMPRREWQRMWDDGRETTSSLQDHQSKQMPGDGR